MSTDTFTKEISRQSGWGIFTGVLTAIAGIAMIVYPAATAAASTIFVGSALIVAAVAQFVFAFTTESFGSFFFKLLVAILYGVAGVLLVAYPVAAVLSLTGVLGAMLVAEGIVEMIIAFAAPSLSGRGWFLVSAISNLVLGVLILAEWPSSSVWAIGTMVGVGVLISGITRVVISSAVHHEAGAMTPKSA